jgi:hypothetical protein
MAHASIPHDFRVRLATEHDCEAVLAVRRAAYAELIAKSGAAGLIADEFDAAPHCRSYLLVAPDGDFAGTIRPCLHTAHFGWPLLPLARFAPQEAARLVSRGVPVVQSTLLGIMPRYRTLGLFPTLSLLRAVCGAAQAFGADHFLSVLDSRPTKIGFWSRFGWRAVSPPMPHPFTRDGAVIIFGSIADTLRIADEWPQFRVLNEFASDVRGSGVFPEVI